MTEEPIIIMTFGYFEKHILDDVIRAVYEEFHHPVKYREGHIDLSEFYDPARRQYDANRLIREIEMNFATNDTKTIGLFNVDLFIPILTYIFGQAYLKGHVGIASSFRLGNERYGLKPDEKLLIERFAKEVIHELGHTFGLIHCQHPECVMRSSTYVEDIDQKEQHLCLQCRKLMER